VVPTAILCGVITRYSPGALDVAQAPGASIGGGGAAAFTSDDRASWGAGRSMPLAPAGVGRGLPWPRPA
jgi:hypothetical protein